MGKTKDLKKKAQALRIKEKRLRRQSGLLSQGHDLLAAARAEGRAYGLVEGLTMAHDMSERFAAKGHKQRLDQELRDTIAHFKGG